MINIQFIKKKKEQEFALKYYGKDFGVLSGEESALCSYAAETFSYIDIAFFVSKYKCHFNTLAEAQVTI